MQFRGYGQQGAGERRRGGGRGRGAGGRIKEERRELTPTRQDTLSIIIRRSVLEQNCELHSRLMTLTLALHYAAL